MDWFVIAFVKSALAWFLLGVTLGLAMAIHPPWVIYLPVHAHMNLLGFVTMMIYGVAYHVLPRFAGRVLFSRTIAGVHWWVSNIGLALMVAGFTLRVHDPRDGTITLAAGGVLAALGAYLFVFNLWRTMSAPAPRRPDAGATPITAMGDGTRRT